MVVVEHVGRVVETELTYLLKGDRWVLTQYRDK